MQNTDMKATARDHQTPRAKKYRQAAVGYFIYGLIYLFGAMYLSTRGEGPGGGWIWFGVGAAMVVLFPILIWKEMKWAARILAVLVAVRVLGILRLIADGAAQTVEMPWGGELPMLYGAIVFVLIAAAECYLLVRAGWDL